MLKYTLTRQEARKIRKYTIHVCLWGYSPLRNPTNEKLRTRIESILKEHFPTVKILEISITPTSTKAKLRFHTAKEMPHERDAHERIKALRGKLGDIYREITQEEREEARKSFEREEKIQGVLHAAMMRVDYPNRYVDLVREVSDAFYDILGETPQDLNYVQDLLLEMHNRLQKERTKV